MFLLLSFSTRKHGTLIWVEGYGQLLQYHTLNSTWYRPTFGYCPNKRCVFVHTSWVSTNAKYVQTFHDLQSVFWDFCIPYKTKMHLQQVDFPCFCVGFWASSRLPQVRCLFRSRQSSKAVRSPRQLVTPNGWWQKQRNPLPKMPETF